MVESVTKSVKVPADTAAEWEDYAEQTPSIDNTSHLIRMAVQHEISENYDVIPREGAADGDGGGGGAVGGEVLTLLQQMQGTLEDVDERLTALEDLESTEADYDLQKAAHAVLPTRDGGDPTDVHQWAATADDIARQIGADAEDVADALDELAETSGEVKQLNQEVESRSGGGPEYYWKRGGGR